MGIKILAFMITLVLNAAAVVVILATMILAMNGYSERDAGWGLIAFIVLAAAMSILAGIGAAASVTLLVRRQYTGIIAVLISIAVFTVLGVVSEIVCSLVGIGVAEFVRVKH